MSETTDPTAGERPCVICRRPEHEHRDRNGHGFVPTPAEPDAGDVNSKSCSNLEQLGATDAGDVEALAEVIADATAGDVLGLQAGVLAELGMCQFYERVDDASMCRCGIPTIDHDAAAERIVLRDNPAAADLLASLAAPLDPLSAAHAVLASDWLDAVRRKAASEALTEAAEVCRSEWRLSTPKGIADLLDMRAARIGGDS